MVRKHKKTPCESTAALPCLFGAASRYSHLHVHSEALSGRDWANMTPKTRLRFINIRVWSRVNVNVRFYAGSTHTYTHSIAYIIYRERDSMDIGPSDASRLNDRNCENWWPPLAHKHWWTCWKHVTTADNVWQGLTRHISQACAKHCERSLGAWNLGFLQQAKHRPPHRVG